MPSTESTPETKLSTGFDETGDELGAAAELLVAAVDFAVVTSDFVVVVGTTGTSPLTVAAGCTAVAGCPGAGGETLVVTAAVTATGGRYGLGDVGAAVLAAERATVGVFFDGPDRSGFVGDGSVLSLVDDGSCIGREVSGTPVLASRRSCIWLCGLLFGAGVGLV